MTKTGGLMLYHRDANPSLSIKVYPLVCGKWLPRPQRLNGCHVGQKQSGIGRSRHWYAFKILGHNHACRRLYLVLCTIAIPLCILHKPAYTKTPFRLRFRFSTVEILGVSNAAK